MKWFIVAMIAVTLFTACEKNNYEPVQPVILNDTSKVSGNLIARIYDASTGATIEGADVLLYTSYEDVLRHLPALNIKSLATGDANFGSVLFGNYYITAQKGFKRDTVSAQVLSQNKTIRVMNLR